MFVAEKVLLLLVISLTANCDLVTPHGDIDLGQHQLWQWLAA